MVVTMYRVVPLCQKTLANMIHDFDLKTFINVYEQM